MLLLRSLGFLLLGFGLDNIGKIAESKKIPSPGWSYNFYHK